MWIVTEKGIALNTDHVVTFEVIGKEVVATPAGFIPDSAGGFPVVCECASQQEAHRLLGVIVQAIGNDEPWVEAMILRERVIEMR
jgi:hypothetical protein